MAAEIGQFALVLAFLVGIIQSIFPLIGAQRGDARLVAVGVPAAQAQFVFILTSFLCLIYLYAISDFSVENVFQNSHSTKPFIYKLTGAWANHEGSMVLWVLILSVFGLSVASAKSKMPAALQARVLAVQGMIGVAFLAFILFTSNPFLRIFPVPVDGQGLNPLLQDPGLVLHPPFLYLGYVGFSVTFSFAVAALIEGKVDAVWAHFVRPWALIAWCFLTVGIALGSWWAYYELGWGGWWFWDPVENASFMPWLVGTALLHSAIVAEKRDALKTWTVLLAILTFSLSLVGTFLVRSGILTSVHAFAVDAERGVFILALLVLAIGGSLTLFAIRAPSLKPTGVFAPVSREGSLVVNNLLMISACATVFLGTFYPLFVEATSGEKISVGPPFFNTTIVPLFVPALILMVLGPVLAWKRGDPSILLRRLKFAFAATGVLALFVLAVRWPVAATGLMGAVLAGWIIFGSLAELGHRLKLFQIPLSHSLTRSRNLGGNAWGTLISHMGVGVVVAGITGVSVWKEEVVDLVRPGEVVSMNSFNVTLESVEDIQGPNYASTQATFAFRSIGESEVYRRLVSEKRFYNVRQMETTEAGIGSSIFGDVYATIGEPNDRGEWTVRLYYNPLVPWMWVGSAIMVFGGMISLSDRRLRVGAPKRSSQAKSSIEPKAV